MSEKNFIEMFEEMGFFETMEDDDTFVYCYEPKEDGDYLIVSDEMGNTPKEGSPFIVACYGDNDAFLWQVEFEQPGDFYEIYRNSQGGQAFIDELKKLANA